MQKRHGDLLLVQVNAIPENAVALSHLVLAEGEVTGHAHRADTGVLYERDGNLYLDVSEAKATLSHEEHGPIELECGCWKVIRQVEYTPTEIRNVAD